MLSGISFICWTDPFSSNILSLICSFHKSMFIRSSIKCLFITTNSPPSVFLLYKLEVNGSKHSLLPSICAVEAVGRAAAKLGYSHMPAVSGAGHDAVYMAKLAPSGMIFIPCKDGISHNEIEDAKPEHITAGCNVLLQAMLERAG